MKTNDYYKLYLQENVKCDFLVNHSLPFSGKRLNLNLQLYNEFITSELFFHLDENIGEVYVHV